MGTRGNAENISVDSQLNVEDIVFECGVVVSILVSVYGMIQFILAIRRKDKEKRYRAQKVIVYSFLFLLLWTFLFFPKNVIL